MGASNSICCNDEQALDKNGKRKKRKNKEKL